jgi:hypothetical protein
MEEFLKALGVSSNIIEDAKKDGANFKELAKQFKDDQREIIATDLRKEIEADLKEKINADALKATQNSLKTKLNRELGLNLTNIREIDFEEFVTKAKEAVDGIKTSVDGDTKKVDELNTKLLNAFEEIESYKTKLTDKEKEVEATLKAERAKLNAESYISKTYSAIKWVGDENLKNTVKFAQDTLRNEIHNNYVVGDDGSLKNKDGSPVIKDKDTIVRTLEDYITSRVSELNLVEQNTARTNGRPVVVSTGDQKRDGQINTILQEMEAKLK